MNKSVTRRGLLRGAVATGAALRFPTILPSVVFGKDPDKPAPSNRITMGFIGLGGQGMGLMSAFLGNKECQVLAVCDVDKPHLDGAKKKVDGQYKNEDSKAYSDYSEVLSRGDIDAVCIATPNQWHAVMAVAAARAGKDMYIEKPITLTLREGRAVCDAVAKYGRILQVGSMQRSDGNFRFACELARGGRLGKIQKVEVALLAGAGPQGPSSDKEPKDPPAGFDYDRWLGPSPWVPYCKGRIHWNWRWLMDYGGGQLMDWVGHHVDIANWGMNWEHTGPVEVEGTGEYVNDILYDAATKYRIKAKFADGVTLEISESREPYGKDFCDSFMGGTKFSGSDGWVWVQRGGIKTSDPKMMELRNSPELPRLYETKGHQANFLSCVKSRRQPICTAEIGHRAASVGHLSQIAMLTGRKIKWDPRTEQIDNDPAATALLSRAMREPWKV